MKKRICFSLIVLLSVLAASSRSQWVSTNGPNAGAVYAIAVSPSSGGSGTNLFAGTSAGGVFLSTDNGTSWTAVDSGLTTPYVWSLAVSDTNLFAGTWGGVFVSTNNGTSWTADTGGLSWTLEGGGPTTRVWSLAVSGKYLFAGTNGGGVFRSTIGDTNWTAVNEGLTNPYVCVSCRLLQWGRRK